MHTATLGSHEWLKNDAAGTTSRPVWARDGSWIRYPLLLKLQTITATLCSAVPNRLSWVPGQRRPKQLAPMRPTWARSSSCSKRASAVYACDQYQCSGQAELFVRHHATLTGSVVETTPYRCCRDVFGVGVEDRSQVPRMPDPLGPVLGVQAIITKSVISLEEAYKSLLQSPIVRQARNDRTRRGPRLAKT